MDFYLLLLSNSRSSWGLISFLQVDSSSSWDEIFPDKPEIGSDNLPTTKSTCLTFWLNSCKTFLPPFSLYVVVLCEEKHYLVPLTTNDFISNQSGFVYCNLISSGRELEAIVGIPECSGTPQSKIARKKKQPKTNSVLQDLSHIKAFIENSASTIKSLTVSFQLLQPRSPFLEENLAFKTAAFYEWKLEMVFGQKKEKTLKLNSKYKSSMKREFASWVKQVSSKVFFSSFFFWWNSEHISFFCYMTFCSNHFGDPGTSAQGAFYQFLILTFHTFITQL